MPKFTEAAAAKDICMSCTIGWCAMPALRSRGLTHRVPALQLQCVLGNQGGRQGLQTRGKLSDTTVRKMQQHRLGRDICQAGAEKRRHQGRVLWHQAATRSSLHPEEVAAAFACACQSASLQLGALAQP